MVFFSPDSDPSQPVAADEANQPAEHRHHIQVSRFARHRDLIVELVTT